MGSTSAGPLATNEGLQQDVLQLNALLDRAALLASSIDGSDRDLNAECGYPDTISTSDFKTQYARNGIAKRVVQCFPVESWQVAPLVRENEEGEDTDFEAGWAQLMKSRRPLHYLARADILSGIGRFGVILLGLDDGKPLDEPVDGITERGDQKGQQQLNLTYLRVFDESVLTVDSTESDPTNPRYGRPTRYKIDFATKTEAGTSTTTQTVHWSRILHVADNLEMSEIYGTPRMQPVYNRIFDCRKLLGGSAEMFWQGAFPGLTIEGDPSLVAKGAELDIDSIREQIQNYINGMQRYIAVQGVNVKSLNNQVADPTAHIEIQLKVIAMTIGIPFRVLFGSEQAQLASREDARNWNARVAKRQADYLTPCLVRPFVDRLVTLGVLPAPQDGYEIVWPDRLSASDSERAEVAKVQTEALAKYYQGGVDQIIPPETYLRVILQLSDEQVDAVMAAAAEYIGGSIGAEEPGGEHEDLPQALETYSHEEAGE